MPFFSRLIKSGRAQRAATESLDFSANVPSSGPTSVQNSKGTSKTSAEVIPLLQHAFEDFDPDEEVGSNFKSLKVRLGERIGRYSNVGFPPIFGHEWTAPSEVRKLIQIAIECSVDVYGSSDSVPDMKDLAFSRAQHIPASPDAVTKATKIFEVHSSPAAEEGKIDPLLIIAIRGTVKSSLDWTVNLNIETTDAKEFLEPISDAIPTDQQTSLAIKVHTGFLTGAKKLLPILLKRLDYYRSTPYKHVLFTGHSAGGAISSLLFMNILGRAKISYPEFRFSLVTFGAPPITSRLLTAELKRLHESLPCPGVVLAIINEHDPITRLDSSYVKSILDLYNKGTGTLTGIVDPSSELWSLPTPELYLVGDLVILKEINLEDSMNSNVHAYKATHATLIERIFCDFRMHGKDVYLQRVRRWANQE